MPEDGFAWNGDIPRTELPETQEQTPFSPSYTLDYMNDIYLARIENQLVHKYAPDLVQRFVLQSKRAIQREDTLKKDDHHIFTDPSALLRAISGDVRSAPLLRENSDHKPRISRPGVGAGYQRELFGEE